MFTKQGDVFRNVYFGVKKCKGKDHPCAGTEALYKPYGP
jgi:hypothetical protein